MNPLKSISKLKSSHIAGTHRECAAWLLKTSFKTRRVVQAVKSARTLVTVQQDLVWCCTNSRHLACHLAPWAVGLVILVMWPTVRFLTKDILMCLVHHRIYFTNMNLQHLTGHNIPCWTHTPTQLLTVQTFHWCVIHMPCGGTSLSVQAVIELMQSYPLKFQTFPGVSQRQRHVDVTERTRTHTRC